MKRALAVVPLLGLVAALTAAAPAPRFEVLAHVRPAGFYTADVFAHRGHAYLSSERGARACPASGVRVYDVRNVRRPRLVSTFARRAGTWTEKTIVRRIATPSFQGDLAVTTFQACARDAPPSVFRGFGLYDVTDPAEPRELALVETDARGAHEIWLAAPRGRALVYTAIPRAELLTGRPDFRIFDVANPRRPLEVGAWGAIAELGAPATQGTLVHSVITNAAATRAYLSYWNLGTVVLDVADPARPRYLGRTPADQCCAHSAALDAKRGLLIETHETDRGHPTLYDVSAPARPRRLSTIRAPLEYRPGGAMGDVSRLSLTRSVHDPRLAGKTAFFSWYGQGVVAVDLANPRRPKVKARFLPRPERDPEQLICPGRACTAVWGVYPLGPRTVLASDLISGLWILRLR